MTITKNKMLTIGQRLKIARKEKGLTIEQVSDVIKIRKKYLQAIENSHYEIFPSVVYTKGFLRNYAVFLGLEPEKAVALYRRECEEKKEEGLESAQKPIDEPKFVLTPGKIIFSVLMFSILALFGYFFNQYQKFAAPPFLDIHNPKTGDELVEDIVTIEGSTEVGSVVTINDQAISTDDLGNFKVTVSLREGTNSIKVASENGIGKKSEEYVDVFYKVDEPVVAGANTEEENTTDSNDIEIEDSENIVYDGLEMEVSISPNSAWLLVETDDEIAFSGVLVSDSVKTFRASEKIYIKTGNAGSTNVTINGQEQESLGEEGVVESREFSNNSSFSNISETESTEDLEVEENN